MQIRTLITKHEQRQEADLAEIKDALFACGWGCHSHLPGGMCLWTKSFPESHTQGTWGETGEDHRLSPHPPFTVNGATLETAIAIERAWQAHWDDEQQAIRVQMLEASK